MDAPFGATPLCTSRNSPVRPWSQSRPGSSKRGSPPEHRASQIACTAGDHMREMPVHAAVRHPAPSDGAVPRSFSAVAIKSSKRLMASQTPPLFDSQIQSDPRSIATPDGPIFWLCPTSEFPIWPLWHPTRPSVVSVAEGQLCMIRRSGGQQRLRSLWISSCTGPHPCQMHIRTGFGVFILRTAPRFCSAFSGSFSGPVTGWWNLNSSADYKKKTCKAALAKSRRRTLAFAGAV